MIFFYLLILIMPLTNHSLWARYVGDLTLAKYVGGLCLLYALFHLGARRSLPTPFSTWHARWFFVLYLIAAASYFNRSLPSSNWEVGPFVGMSSLLILSLITMSVVDSLERLRWVLLVAIGAGAFASLYVLREWQKYRDVYPGFRPGAVVGDANYFSLSALLCLPLAFLLAARRGQTWERLFCVGCLLLTIAAFLLAASRGGFIGLVVAVLLIVWRSRHRARNLALAATVLIALTLVAPASPLERFLHPSTGDQEAITNRAVVWKAGWRMFRSNPLLGVGLGNFKPLVAQYEDASPRVRSLAHNSYLEIGAELGLPSLLVFLAILFCGYRTLGRVRERTRRSGPALLHQAASGIQVGLIGCAVPMFFVSAQYQRFYWLMVFLSMCLPSLATVEVPKGKTALGRGRTGLAQWAGGVPTVSAAGGINRR